MVVELEVNQTQVQRIIQSKAFRTSEIHRNLLQYLAEKSLTGAAGTLKEYTVGLDVFAKPASYDPRQESVVRMHVARLRQKLAEYYRTEGLNDSVIVDVPKGGFRVTFEQREIPPEPVATPGPAAAEPPRPNNKILAVLLSTAVVIALVFGLQLWHLRAKQAEVPGSTAEVRELWGSLLSTSRPLMICLATGNDGTANGAFVLGQFLAGRKDNVLVTRADQLAMPELLMNNVVFLGPVSGNRQIEALSKGQPLVLEPGGIRNLNPRPGEPAFIPDPAPGALAQAPLSKDVEETHALITHVPGLYGNGDMLYLSGNQLSSTLAAVRAFTDPGLARILAAKLRSSDGRVPRFFQLVLRVQSMDGMPIQISYLFHRDLSPVSKP